MYPTLRCSPALFEKDLTGQVYIVTGGNSGAGLATVEQLVRQGAHVIAACRRVGAGKEATANLASEKGSVEILELDLGRLQSVRSFAKAFEQKYGQLHGLVNNAGVMNTPEGRTEDGFETQFGINYLGHFLLTELLLEQLRAGSPSRIVFVSSVMHVGTKKRVGTIELDDIQFDTRDYDPGIAYTQSKLAMVINAAELGRRLEGSGVSSFSVHPGWIRSNLIQHTMPTWIQNVVLKPFGGLLGLMSAEDGAQTTLHCLLDDDAPKNTGAYYSQNSILYPAKSDRRGGWPMRSPNPHAHDVDLASRLYEQSCALVGLPQSTGATGAL